MTTIRRRSPKDGLNCQTIRFLLLESCRADQTRQEVIRGTILQGHLSMPPSAPGHTHIEEQGKVSYYSSSRSRFGQGPQYTYVLRPCALIWGFRPPETLQYRRKCLLSSALSSDWLRRYAEAKCFPRADPPHRLCRGRSALPQRMIQQLVADSRQIAPLLLVALGPSRLGLSVCYHMLPDRAYEMPYETCAVRFDSESFAFRSGP